MSPYEVEAPMDVALDAPHHHAVLANSYRSAVDLYWSALSHLQNVLEDVSGADGRLEYLRALATRLVVVLQQMDAVLDSGVAVRPGHEAAFALEHGLRFCRMSGETLVEALHVDDEQVVAEVLAHDAAQLGRRALTYLPGALPEAQGTSGQRQIIRAMRNWSLAAADTGDDLGFLAERLHEL